MNIVELVAFGCSYNVWLTGRAEGGEVLLEVVVRDGWLDGT